MRSNTQLSFRVFYLWDFGVSKKHDPQFGTSIAWDVDLLSGYENEILPNIAKNPGPERFFGFDNPALEERLSEWRPNALLLFGYKWASHLRVIRWARSNGVPLLFRGDSHLLGRGSPRLHVRLALRLLFSKFSSFLYVGKANREYFEAFGVPPERLFFAPHSVNAGHFSRENPEVRQASKALREQLGIAPGASVVLFAGKFLPAKQPVALLEAFLGADPLDTYLVFVGDGPEKDKLKAMVDDPSASPGRSRVRFLPFANQSEMPSRYLLADLFVLPSKGRYETWGLAVNEAMHMGVPCLVSSRVGCQRDLVLHGETGWVFDPDDPRALNRALVAALEELRSESRKEEIVQAVGRKIAGYTYAQTTSGLLEALSTLRH